MQKLVLACLLASFGPIYSQATVPVPALDPPGLSQMLKSGQWTVVEFGGPKCIPCKKMQPILAEIQKQLGSKVQVRNFYITQYQKEAKAYQIISMPTQVVFDPSGKEVSRHIGLWEKEDFLAGLAKVGLK